MPELATERRHVGDGWQPLIDEIDQKLIQLLGSYEVLQIKEKFGGLRFYVSFPEGPDHVIDQAWGIVHDGENRSFDICEECGRPANVVSIGGWWQTLCPEHKDERVERHIQDLRHG